MEARNNFHLLISLMFLSVFCSQALALPLESYSTMSRLGNGILFDGPNEPDQNLGLLKVENDRLESSFPESDLSFLYAPRFLKTDNRLLEKRHSDAVFTDSYSQHLRNKALKKYIEKFLSGKRSEEDDFNLEP
ncbi:VIP peptides [Macrotis lagotis]|uniref:VIP peptides n=1 Tax=Macrotis lagotis TaxID=92651 RepID=UPI003D683BDC